MGTKKQAEPRFMELEIPQEAMMEVAEIVAESDIEASLLGIGDKVETIAIEFNYTPEQRDSMMEILELVDDYNSSDNEEEEQEEESEED